MYQQRVTLSLRKAFILLILIFYVSEVPAATITGNPVLDFGTIMQSGSPSKITLDFSGLITSYSNIYHPENTSSSSNITFETNVTGVGNFEKILLQPEGAYYNGATPNCSVSVENVTSDLTNAFILKRSGGLCSGIAAEQAAKFTATLILDGRCDEGTFSGKIIIPYQSEQCSLRSILSCSTDNANCGSPTYPTVEVGLSFTITEPLEVKEIQVMNFGRIMSPSSGGTVTLGYDGTISKSATIWTDGRVSVTPGIFQVSGILNQQVNVSLPASAVIYNGSNSMPLTNFDSNAPITLLNGGELSATGNVSVGATLNVNADQAVGDYSGTYTITVSY